ncbi:MAG: hypothetical protein KBS97_02815, partial [Firmicutes bacterium]|nr:hypothetical protein [Candidatus Fiminaster equi]
VLNMKKRLLILPLLALTGSMLVGCDDDNNQGGDDFDPSAKLAPASWFDSDGNEHKRVSNVEDGQTYYLCYHRKTDDEIRAFNGEPHKDGGKEYPYYLGTSVVANGEGESSGDDEQVEVLIEFTEDNKFTMKCVGEGTQYNGMYASIYKSVSSYGNNGYSFHFDETLGNTFEDEGETYTCYYEFEMMSEYNGYTLGVPVIKLQDERFDEEEPQPKFLGSGVDGDGVGYISIDCTTAEKAMIDTYNLAFFYEV